MLVAATGNYYYCPGHYHFVGYSGVYLQIYPENQQHEEKIAFFNWSLQETYIFW